MCNDVDIRAAKKLVFGEPPESAVSKIGYDMAKRYYEPLIRRMEQVLNDNQPADAALTVCLEKAIAFPSYPGFDRFPEETRRIIRLCGERFTRRYHPLLDHTP